MNITENINRIKEGKQSIRLAINNKGGNLTKNQLIGDYADVIDAFDIGQGVVFNNKPSKATTVQIIPETFTADWTDFGYMFNNCTALTTIPQLLDTSKGILFNNMFSGCKALSSIPSLNVQNGIQFFQMFQNCSALTDFGGLLNVKKSFYLSSCNNLTHESLLNVLNGLYDLTGGTSQKLTLGSTNLAKLTDEEKAIATNKNWTLA